MLTNNINETSVWLDQQEDEGLDVSLMRLLCSYNYLACIINDIYINGRISGNGWGYRYNLDVEQMEDYFVHGAGEYNDGCGDGDGTKYSDGDIGYYEEYIGFNNVSIPN